MPGTYALTTVAKARSYLGLGTSAEPLLDRLIDVATAKIETHCQRQLMSRAYTSWVDGKGAEYLYVPNYPISQVDRICTARRDVMQVKNTASDAAYATLRATTTGLVLTIGGGTSAGSDSTGLYATYATVTLLTARVNAIGSSWTAEVIGSYGAIPSTEIRPVGGRACLDQWTALSAPDLPASEIEIDENAGKIWVSGGVPEGRENVFVGYTGGYATAPDDLEQACIELVGEMYQARGRDSSVASETLGDHSITYAMQMQVTDRASALLAPYKRIIQQ